MFQIELWAIMTFSMDNELKSCCNSFKCNGVSLFSASLSRISIFICLIASCCCAFQSPSHWYRRFNKQQQQRRRLQQQHHPERWRKKSNPIFFPISKMEFCEINMRLHLLGLWFNAISVLITNQQNQHPLRAFLFWFFFLSQQYGMIHTATERSTAALQLH